MAFETDLLDVDDAAGLAGTLNLSLINGFTPTLGQRVKIELPGKTAGRRKAGTLAIRYSSFEELDGIFERLGFQANQEG